MLSSLRHPVLLRPRLAQALGGLCLGWRLALRASVQGYENSVCQASTRNGGVSGRTGSKAT
jgi:hypothetical protein